MHIEEICQIPSPSQLNDLRRLMLTLDESMEFNSQAIKQTIESENSHLYCLMQGETIVGCCSLCFFHSPTGRKASLEDVVISPSYQGQGLGKMLMEFVLEQCKTMAPLHLQLTSRAFRTQANILYPKMGMQKKETNVYTMDFQ